MTRWMVHWQGMKADQEYYTQRLVDAKKYARACAIVFGHAEVLSLTADYREIHFDRHYGVNVKEVEM